MALFVIPGLVPGIHRSAMPIGRHGAYTWQRRIEVLPVRISSLDQVYLPGARPLFHGLLALDCMLDISEFLEPNEGADTVFAGESGREALRVLFDTTNETVRDANVKRPSRFACEDVDPISQHDGRSDFNFEYAAVWIPGTSPGMTVVAGSFPEGSCRKF